MTAPPTFISPSIIERIENGSFIPTRRSKPSMAQAERRNILSPLTVTKRCIRYEPNVFYHRQPFILRMARSLNQPETKIVLIGGSQGSGKTSLVRGLIELMGSRNEQLLWFDVNRHTDFEEIIQFLIQYITHVCVNQGESGRTSPLTTPTQEDPLKRLEALIVQVADTPLLLVLDNVEYIVDPELRFNSYPFKEMLNFLLTFPNIKMVLIGERLPHADMSPNQEGVAEIRLEGLPQAEAVTFLENLNKTATTPPDAAILENVVAPTSLQQNLQQLWQKTHGQPWLLKIAQHLKKQANVDLATLNRLLQTNPDNGSPDSITDNRDEQSAIIALTSLIYQRLPDQHRRLFQVLCFLRHPVDPQTLVALTGVCFPILGPARMEREALQDILEHSLLRDLLKINYPPQEVLEQIRRRNISETHQSSAERSEKKFKPWYELYHKVKQILYSSLPHEERERIHGVLQEFYRQEKAQEPERRILKLTNRALLSEAKYHGNAGRERKPTSSGSGILATSEEPPLASKAYLAGFNQAGSSNRPLTLADYKNIQLPDSPSLTEPEDSPSFLHLLRETSASGSLQDDLNDLGLSEEERQLLQQQQSLGEMLKAEAAKQPQASPAPIKPLPETTQAKPPQEDVLSAIQASHSQDEQEKAIQSRLALAVAAQNHALIAQELVELARYRSSHGRYESAAQCLEKALSLKASAPKEIVAEAYRLNGSVNKETFHHNAALSSLQKAAEQIRKLMYEDDTVGTVWMGRLGKVHHDLGEIYAYRKQYTQAIESFQQALRWYQSADNPASQAEVYFQLAGAYDDQGEIQSAIAAYHKALNLDEAQGNHTSAAATLCNLSLLYQEQEEWTEALHCLEKALRYDQANQNQEGQWNTLESLCHLHRSLEDWAQATRVAQQGLVLAIQEQSALWQANFYTQLGQIEESQEQWAKALKQFQLAQSSGESVLASKSLDWLDAKLQHLRKQI